MMRWAETLVNAKRVLGEYEPLVANMRAAADSSSRTLIRANMDRTRSALGACKAAVNLAEQDGFAADATVQRLRALVDELVIVRSMLADAFEAADELNFKGFIRELTLIVRREVGKERQVAWFTEAEANRALREDATVTRRMGAGVAIPLGTSGTAPRERRKS